MECFSFKNFTCGKASLVNPLNGNGRLVSRQSALINGSVDSANFGSMINASYEQKIKPKKDVANRFIGFFLQFPMKIPVN